MEKEYIDIKLDRNMKETGLMICSTAQELKFQKMAQLIPVSLETVKNKVLEPMHGLMELIMKANGQIIKLKGLVSINGQMAGDLKAVG